MQAYIHTQMCLKNWDREAFWRGRFYQMKSQEFASSCPQCWHTTMLEVGRGPRLLLLLIRVLTNGYEKLIQHNSFTHGWASSQWTGVLVSSFGECSLDLRWVLLISSGNLNLEVNLCKKSWVRRRDVFTHPARGMEDKDLPQTSSPAEHRAQQNTGWSRVFFLI